MFMTGVLCTVCGAQVYVGLLSRRQSILGKFSFSWNDCLAIIIKPEESLYDFQISQFHICGKTFHAIMVQYFLPCGLDLKLTYFWTSRLTFSEKALTLAITFKPAEKVGLSYFTFIVDYKYLLQQDISLSLLSTWHYAFCWRHDLCLLHAVLHKWWVTVA